MRKPKIGQEVVWVTGNPSLGVSATWSGKVLAVVTTSTRVAVEVENSYSKDRPTLTVPLARVVYVR